MPSVEVKAGRSGPRVEWSSPGRRWAPLGVHGQLEPLQDAESDGAVSILVKRLEGPIIQYLCGRLHKF